MTDEDHWLVKKARFAARLVGFYVPPREPKHLSHLFGGRCRDCHLRVVKASGPLINGRCGACDTAFRDREGLGDMPPAA